MFLSVTSATWIVTGLGFGIVLALLFCLVFILQGFGYIMQKATAPKAPKPEPAKAEPAVEPADVPAAPVVAAVSAEPTDEGTMAAIAYALYLSRDTKHDIPTAMIHAQARETAWNTKSYGLNNQGF